MKNQFMKKNKILKSALHICFVLISTNSISQIKSSLSIEPGINRDSLVSIGTNLKYTHYLQNKPFSINVSVGYYSLTNRSGESEFNYSYYNRTNLISSLGLNYLAIQNKVGFNLEILARLSFVQLNDEQYKKSYNYSLRAFQTSDVNESRNNAGIGLGVVLKKRFKNQSAIFILAGTDYLAGNKVKFSQNLNLGLEIPLSKIRTKNDKHDLPKNKTKVVNEQTRTKVEKQKIKEITAVKQKQDVIKKVNKDAPVKSPSKLTKDTVSVLPQKELVVKPIIKNTIVDSALTITNSSEVKKSAEKINTIQPVIEEKPKGIQSFENNAIENKPIIEKEIITEKKPVKTEPKKEVKSVETVQPITKKIKENPSIKSKTLKVEGPKDIEGFQYEIGDSWNYWEGENNKWYAKRKGKTKWYDLIESLSNSNYNKASLILQEEGKKVE